MDKAQARDFLQQTLQAMGPVTREMVDELFALCHHKHLQKGQMFIHAGDHPSHVGFNLSGVFRLFYIDADGNDWTKGFSIPGRFVISYSAIVQKRPSHFYIESVVESELLVFEYSRWMRLVERNPAWYPIIFILLQTVYIMKETREMSFLLEDAATRYARFQEEYPGIQDSVKQYHVASFLGITPEGLSRIRKKMKKY
jgi:CRP-like cAMP-binding protein